MPIKLKDKKGELTLSKFLISLLIVSMVVIGVFGFVGTLNLYYGDSLDEETSSFMGNNTANLEKLENQSSQIAASINENTTSGNIVDLLGGIFQAGIGTAKISLTSIDISKNVIDSGFSATKIGETGNDKFNILDSFKTTVIVIIAILFFVTIFLAIILGRKT